MYKFFSGSSTSFESTCLSMLRLPLERTVNMPLKLVHGKNEYNLDTYQRLRIGRSEQADIVVKGDPLVSSNHCVISAGVLVDANSTNGTFINSARVRALVVCVLTAQCRSLTTRRFLCILAMWSRLAKPNSLLVSSPNHPLVPILVVIS